MKKIKAIPPRLVLTVAVSLAKTAAVLASVAVLSINLPYFYTAVRLASIICLVKIIASDDNPEYKIPWLILVLIMPTVGFMLYVMFYSRILPLKHIRRLDPLLSHIEYRRDDTAEQARLKELDAFASGQARLLCELSGSHIFANTDVIYFSSGREALYRLLKDISAAKHFIYLEYYIIAEGEFFKTLLDALSERASAGVDVRIVYDDAGCIRTLPSDFPSTMRARGISAVPFSRLRGSADSAFNNRSHRKITAVDGRIAYTGGINIADEYIGLDSRLGVWKDTCVRLCGEGAMELTKLFLFDYWLNAGDFDVEELKMPTYPETNSDFDVEESQKTIYHEINSGDGEKGELKTSFFALRKSRRAKKTSARRVAPNLKRGAPHKTLKMKKSAESQENGTGFVIPFGDGPRPLYSERVGKSIITAMISSASESVYITTPYLIIDGELLCIIENAARRGVRVKIVLPSIPDKPLVYLMSESFFPRLIRAGVEIYLFADGFIHSKTYLVDGKYALVGTMNLDYRSLAHNFECGVWLYGSACIEQIKADAQRTLVSSRRIYESMIRRTVKKRLVCALVRIIAPLM